MEERLGSKPVDGKGPIRAKEGIISLYKYGNALNHGVIELLYEYILAAPCMCSAIENGFMVSYSSPTHASEYASSKGPKLWFPS